VAADFTGDETAFAHQAAGRSATHARRGQRKSAPSLIRARLLQGAKRQLPTFVIVMALIAGIGVMYQVADGVRWQASLPLWLAIGAGGGLAAGAALELARNTVTSVASLGKHRGYTVLGAAPELTPAALRELPPDARTPLGCLAFQPASGFATAFRDLQGALDKSRLVSFIASIPNDGASTTALGAAVSARQQGRRVVLVDCDLRRRSLTRLFGRDPAVGVLEAATKPQNWRSVIDHEDETGLAFIPAAELRSPWASLIGAPGLLALIEELKRTYDLVILDCPPALANPEGPALASLADQCVLVAAWDDTTVANIRASMRALLRRANAKVAVFVNRVPPGYRFGRLRPN
jgi:Mrp family chromosome partitioning ATPase